MNSQIRNSESTDSEQHNEADREAKRKTRRPGKPGKTNTRRGRLADTVAHQSLLIPNQIFFLWYEEFVLNSLIFVEITRHIVLDHQVSTHREVLECRSAAAFQMLHFVDACEAKRGCGGAALLEVIISSSLDIVMVTVSSF